MDTARHLTIFRWAALVAAAAILAAGCHSADGPEPTAAPTTTAPSEETLQQIVDRVADDEAVPAIGATVFTSTEVLDAAVAGVRRAGDNTPVALDDRFHLGSDTKAMTAALIGRLVEQGVLGFDMTIADAFPDLAVDPGYEAVTIRHLLSHTAGIDDEQVFGADIGIDESSDQIPLQRARAAEWLVGRAPQLEAGTYQYSNVGFVVAGAAAEAATGIAWEDLMVAEVFQPLGMTSCGFGAPGVDAPEEQPWGHISATEAVPPGPAADNHPILGPAGTVHCSMRDWVRFLQEMMRAGRGESDWLSQETAETIFTPVSDDYALGWGIYRRGDLVAYTHDGSNTMWYASAWLVPSLDLGWVVVTNAAMDPGSLAALQVTKDIDVKYIGG